MNGPDDTNDPSTQNKPVPQRSRLRRWLGPALLLSLAVNLFLGAMIATGAFHKFHGRHGGPEEAGVPPHHRLIAQSLNEEERRIFRRAMRAHFRTLGDEFLTVRDARMALSRAVAAEPYDPVTAKAAFADMRRAMDTIADKAQSAMVESFASLSPETRARIAENLAKGRERERGLWRDGKGRDEREAGERDWPRDHRIPPEGRGDDQTE